MNRPMEFDPMRCAARGCPSEGTKRWTSEGDELDSGWIWLCEAHHKEALRARQDRPDPRQMSLPLVCR